ncbi:hypothetical protein AB0B86_15045 [Micromonospora sp. NPDC049047]|uniref:hypothetical protein n=1 Tax=Micromonospora sp. NPDC049047 TaxID=3155645 RepID=UPI00340EC646
MADVVRVGDLDAGPAVEPGIALGAGEDGTSGLIGGVELEDHIGVEAYWCRRWIRLWP